MSASDDPVARQIPSYRTRLSVLFAADAPRAVILRRGPKRHFALIAWELHSNLFVTGQWMKGVVRLCDLSPHGNKLLYWAAQYHAGARERIDPEHKPFDPLTSPLGRPWTPRPGRKIPRYLRLGMAGGKPSSMPNTGTWTAISTPPYFTALAIWPSCGTWTGGGVFRSEREIVLREGENGLTPAENVPMPATMRIHSARTVAEMQPSAYAPDLDDSEEAMRVRRALAEAGAQWVDWVHLRQGTDMLFAADGCIYELKRWPSVPPPRYLREARLLADFRDMRFQLQRAPVGAMRW